MPTINAYVHLDETDEIKVKVMKEPVSGSTVTISIQPKDRDYAAAYTIFMTDHQLEMLANQIDVYQRERQTNYYCDICLKNDCLVNLTTLASGLLSLAAGGLAHPECNTTATTKAGTFEVNE